MHLDEHFTFVPSSTDNPGIGGDFEELVGSQVADIDVSITKSLRAKYPDLNVTCAPNVPLLAFANAGFATATLDTENEHTFRWRVWQSPFRRGQKGQLFDAVFFAKFNYRWGSEDYILYTIVIGFSYLQYLLKEPDTSETTVSHCSKTDSLLTTAAEAILSDVADYIFVYDRYWTRSTYLYNEVAKASWDKVILDEKTKKALTKVSNDFFDSKEQYQKYGVPWKRGLIFYGPAGNGKTISVKALMHDLMQRNPTVPALYVKTAPYTYDIRNIFSLARSLAPCMLVFEDIETIVTSQTRSYFFNEVDGLENNDGILMVASTNYLDRLDPGLAKRPSRFDRKYLFPLPNQHERTLYAQYWREKVLDRDNDIDFAEELCPAIADITGEFSFAYMQEAFVATLLALARGDYDEDDATVVHSSEDAHLVAHRDDDDDDDDAPKAQSSENKHPELDKYQLWIAFKDEVKNLRGDLDSDEWATPGYSFGSRKRQTLDELRSLELREKHESREEKSEKSALDLLNQIGRNPAAVPLHGQSSHSGVDQAQAVGPMMLGSPQSMHRSAVPGDVFKQMGKAFERWLGDH